ncbi:unnamed protein product [Prorocentrum cordatum]|uniref:Tubulin-specific chaperone A n=1 Tax=Prorocentrum cordatum TaxID=2364126 RepID=A0ABN9VPU3_9DINO|nr:unnamed protein product [Polarella glacialis]
MADPMASALLEAVVRAGGSRQVVAAVAVGLWRAARAEVGGGPLEDKDIEAEVQARVQRIQPVLRAKVEAAAQGKMPCVDGGVLAMRNVAEHDMFGEGAEALPKTGLEAKRRQRHGRRRAAKLDSSSVSEVEVDDGKKFQLEKQSLVSEILVQRMESIEKAVKSILDGSVKIPCEGQCDLGNTKEVLEGIANLIDPQEMYQDDQLAKKNEAQKQNKCEAPYAKEKQFFEGWGDPQELQDLQHTQEEKDLSAPVLAAAVKVHYLQEQLAKAEQALQEAAECAYDSRLRPKD